MSVFEYVSWLVLVVALAGYAVFVGALWVLAGPAAVAVYMTWQFVQRR